MFAAIDVGTNTVRLLIGAIKAGQVVPCRYARSITRLGGNSCVQKGLAPDAMERTLSVLKAFADEAKATGCSTIRAVATEAARGAVNSAAFIANVRQNCGLDLEIISGAEEARLSAIGALSIISPFPQSSLIVDLGGGSTEVIFCRGEAVVKARSYRLGAVRLFELGDADLVRQHLEQFAQDMSADFLDCTALSDAVLIGTAGTITTVAAALMSMAEYDWRRINNFPLTKAALEELSARLTPLSVSERESLPGIEQGRGDILPAGIEILKTIFTTFSKSVMTVSDFGLLEGVLLTLDNAAPSFNDD